MALLIIVGAMELLCDIGSSDVNDLELELAEIAASSVGLRQRADRSWLRYVDGCLSTRPGWPSRTRSILTTPVSRT